MPRYGLPVIGAVLEQAGYEVKVFIEHVAEPDLDWVASADAVLLSCLTGAATRCAEFARGLRTRSRAPLILGGEHASSFADEALDWADYVVRGEGDGVILDLLAALEAAAPVDEIPGLSFKADDCKVHNACGPGPDNINVVHDLGLIHGYPREDGLRLLLKRGKIKLICVQSTRGCPYQCTFCVTPRLFGYSYRYRDVESVVEDIRRKLPYGREFLFVDNLFAVNLQRTERLVDRLIEEGIGQRAIFTCFCRVEIGRFPRLLAKMHHAGVRTICLGLESIDDATLSSIDKRQQYGDSVAAIQAIRAAGIRVSGSFIAGSEGDTRESLLRTADFAVEQGLSSFFYIALWYYPGDPRSPLSLQRHIIPSFDYCTGHFVTHFPARVKPSTLQRTIVEAQHRFWSLGRVARAAVRGDFATATHIASHRAAFLPVERHQLAYAERLEHLEAGYYDGHERLLMDRIATRPIDPIVARAAGSAVVQFDTRPAAPSRTRREAAEATTRFGCGAVRSHAAGQLTLRSGGSSGTVVQPSPRTIRRIACVQLNGEFPDFCARLVMPDYGLPLIGTVLAQGGYDVAVFMEHVKPPEWEAIRDCDLLCLSTLSAGADKTYALADRARATLGVPVVMGGTHATYFPKDCLAHCDYVVLGEGDETILDLVAALAEGRDPAEVPGLAFLHDGHLQLTPARPGPARFDTVPDFGLIQGYRRMTWWDVLRQRRLPLLTVQSSRGCHFHCSYCIVDTMFSAGYRVRDVDSVIRDLRDKRRYGRELLFVDNNFAGVPRYAKALLRRIIEEDFGFDIMVLARTDIARQDELLELMRRAGVTQIYQGYESIESGTLRGYDKRHTVEHIEQAIAKLHGYGFRISGSFVLGADTDTLDTVDATVSFVLNRQLAIAYFFPLWGHYPEAKAGGRAIVPPHRAIFRGWAYCDGNFVTHFPRNMRPSQLQAAINRAYRRVFSPEAVRDAVVGGRRQDALEKVAHRFMWSTIQKSLDAHIPWLEEVEAGFYDAQDRLIEERLLERHARGMPWRFTAAEAAAAVVDAAGPSLPAAIPSEFGCGVALGAGRQQGDRA